MNEPFTRTPWRFINDERIKPTDAWFYAVLDTYGQENGIVTAKIETIADRARMSERTVQRYLARLHDLGWLELVKKQTTGRDTNTWRLRKSPRSSPTCGCERGRACADPVTPEATDEARRGDAAVTQSRQRNRQAEAEGLRDEEHIEDETFQDRGENAASLRSAAEVPPSSSVAAEVQLQEDDQSVRPEDSLTGAWDALEEHSAPDTAVTPTEVERRYLDFPLEPVDTSEAGRWAKDAIDLYFAWRGAQGLGEMVRGDWVGPIGKSIKDVVRKGIPPRIAIDALLQWHEKNSMLGLADRPFVKPGGIVATAVMLYEGSSGVLHGVDGKGTPRPSDYDRSAAVSAAVRANLPDLDLSFLGAHRPTREGRDAVA